MVREVRLTEEQLIALATQVAKSLKAKEFRIIASHVAKSLKPKDFDQIGKTLGKSPVFWIVVLFGLVSVCFTAWKAVPHFVKEKAQMVFNQELTNEIRLQFQEPRISNIVVAVARGEASALMKQEVSPTIENFERGLGEKENEIKAIQHNLTNIQRAAESNVAELSKAIERADEASRFYFMIAKAANLDREAFFEIKKESEDSSNTNAEFLRGVIGRIAANVNASFFSELVGNFGWNVDVKTVSLQTWKSTYHGASAKPDLRLQLLKEVCCEKRFSQAERVDFAIDALKSDKDLKVLEVACYFLDREGAPARGLPSLTPTKNGMTING
jgi:hypothetical protein